MDANVAIRTTVPIFLLIGIGFATRKIGLLKAGDERVLSAYVYYLALPALLLVDLSETSFTNENLSFVLAAMFPVAAILGLFIALHLLFRFSKNTLYLLVVSTIFGSLAFFGLPFLIFAFQTEEVEHLATLSIAAISIVSVAISIAILEIHKLGESTKVEGLKQVAKRLSKNPLILSILLGILVSVSGIEIPAVVAAPLHMLGSTTATVAIFMLGVSLFGRKYTNLTRALGLSLLRMTLLPLIALWSASFFNLDSTATAVLVVMHGVPIAISMVVLSERYNFHRETIASTSLISSVAAGIYLNLWLFLLG